MNYSWVNSEEYDYLNNLRFQLTKFHVDKDENGNPDYSQHTHCRICFAIIVDDEYISNFVKENDRNDYENEGYLSIVNGIEYWICKECFANLKKMFNWSEC